MGSKRNRSNAFALTFVEPMKKLARLVAVLLLLSVVCPSTTIADNTPADIVQARIQLLNGSSIRGTISTIETDGKVIGMNIPSGLVIERAATSAERGISLG